MDLRLYHRQIRIFTLAAGLGLGLAVLLACLVGWNGRVHAQQANTRTPTPSRTATATRTRTPTATASPATLSPIATITATGQVTATRTSTATPDATVSPAVVPVTVTVVVTVTAVATPTAAATPTPTSTPTPTAGPPVVELLETEVLTGTILANRTEVTTTFFLEGRLFELPPLRSTGVAMERPLTALTLYNCEASAASARGEAAPSSDEDCFWDPYPIRQNGFYEIVNGAETGAPLSLMLQEAAPPPIDQIWIQNRTGHSERFLYEDDLYELENSRVLALPLAVVQTTNGDETAPAAFPLLYLRRCLGMDQRAVCEWLPQPVVGGVYYALTDRTEPGVFPNSAVTHIQLEPVLGEERLAALATPTPEPTPEPTEAPIAAGDGAIFCQIQVPTLNVRSGPGTEYLVISQIRQSDASGGRVPVIGRAEADDWVAVDDAVAPGGWIINDAGFVVCEEATGPLPIADITDGRLAAATPTPAAVAQGEETDAADAETGDEEAAEEDEATDSDGIPDGQVRVIATNTFEHDIRFTLSARDHGLPEGTPSEYDLAPGQSVEFLIRAGRIQFSASTPFEGSSGNAEFLLEEGMTRELFLHFVPGSDSDDSWDLRYE